VSRFGVVGSHAAIGRIGRSSEPGGVRDSPLIAVPVPPVPVSAGWRRGPGCSGRSTAIRPTRWPAEIRSLFH